MVQYTQYRYENIIRLRNSQDKTKPINMQCVHHKQSHCIEGYQDRFITSLLVTIGTGLNAGSNTNTEARINFQVMGLNAYGLGLIFM